MPGTPKVVFGKDGGLIEILYAGAGFLHIRRDVYLTIQNLQRLLMCNERFRSPMIPFFHSMVHPIEDGHWYLAEDYAFCQRARASGFKIMADTTIRLWHVGNHSFGWEDAGRSLDRYDTYVLNLGPEPEPPDEVKRTLDELARDFAWPANKPSAPSTLVQNSPPPTTTEFISRCVSNNARLILELGAGSGRATMIIADCTPQMTVIAIDQWRDNAGRALGFGPAVQSDLYDSFVATCWPQRHRIIPIMADTAEGLHRVANANLQPDLVHIGGDRALERVLGDLQSVIDLFPRAVIIGDRWDRKEVRTAVETVTADSGMKCENCDGGWRIHR
jgi:hypothetical protein